MQIALVYMVAGLSSRFKGNIKSFAKVTEKETFIEYSLEQAIPAGFTKIIFVVGKHTEQAFREKFGNNYKGIPVFYALQEFNPKERDKPWGTCDAVCSVINLIEEPFVVCNGDDLYGEKNFETLVNHLNKNESDVTIAINLLEMLPEDGRTVCRGIYKLDKNNYVSDGEESTNISRENFLERGFKKDSPVNMNFFGLHPKTLRFLKEKLEIFKKQNSKDRKKECYLHVQLAKLCKYNKIKMKLYPFKGKWFGITNPGDELEIQKKLN
jgi:NDP-sugar pyrophosphorylase family protein